MKEIAEIQAEITKCLRDMGNLDENKEVELTTLLEDELELDSLAKVDLMVKLEKSFSIDDIPYDEVENWITIQNVIETIQKLT